MKIAFQVTPPYLIYYMRTESIINTDITLILLMLHHA